MLIILTYIPPPLYSQYMLILARNSLVLYIAFIYPLSGRGTRGAGIQEDWKTGVTKQAAAGRLLS